MAKPLFSKLNQAQQKLADEKVKEKKQQRLQGIVNAVYQVMSDNKVNYYEMMDVLLNVQLQFNQQLSDVLTKNFDKIAQQQGIIEGQQETIKEYAQAYAKPQSEEGGGEKTEE